MPTPEGTPPKPAEEPAGPSTEPGRRPRGRPIQKTKPRDLGEVALAWAVMGWFVTFGLVFALSPLMSGYRAGGSAKGLGLLLVLCPALGSIVLGISASRGDQAAEDQGTALQGRIAILSGTLLLPVALIAFYVLIVRV